MRRLVNIGGPRLPKEKIYQAVLVVIDPAHASAHGFQIIFFFRLRGVLQKGKPRLFANVGKSDGNCRTWRSCYLTSEEQMGGLAEQQDERQLDSKTEDGSSNYFQWI